MQNKEYDLGYRTYLEDLFEAVRKISATQYGVTREGYSSKETEVLNYLIDQASIYGLKKTVDKAGNVWLTLEGTNPELPAIVMGSHVDSVPDGGNYDGLAGVIAAFACLYDWKKRSVRFKRNIKVLMLRCEESSFYGKAYVGSLGLMGKLTQKDMKLMHRTENKTLQQAIESVGVNVQDITSGQPLVDVNKIGAFFELHIEQGPVLESSDTIRVGIVPYIRGNVRHKKIVCQGETGHSGAVDRQYRHDALMATAELINKMELRWEQLLDEGNSLVFTVGVLKLDQAAAISVIPGHVTFSSDIRSHDMSLCHAFDQELQQLAQEIGQERGVTFTFDDPIVTQSVINDSELLKELELAAKEQKVYVCATPSGAGHDTAVFSLMGIPTAMIFVANQNGSHNPHEAMKLDDFMQGCDVLRQAVENLAFKD